MSSNEVLLLRQIRRRLKKADDSARLLPYPWGPEVRKRLAGLSALLKRHGKEIASGEQFQAPR